jgi:formylglycine-generating enzyme required for sulfatase activity
MQAIQTKLDLSRELRTARGQSDALFALVRPDSFYERPIPERHRIVFYLGHLEAFDWNLIARGPLDVPSFHPSFDRLFAFGIDPEPGKLPQDQETDWPGVGEVRDYNTRVREALDRQAGHIPEQLLHVAIEHRLMHLETFAYILHNLAYDRKLAPARSAAPAGAVPRPATVEVPGGKVTLGLSSGFGWDNEFKRHEVEVGGFAIAKYKVTNGEYLEFVEAGGPPPYFWKFRGSQWFCQGMWEEIPLPLNWPVYVSCEQAAAYASWKGGRLPTEAEYQRAADFASADPQRDNFDFHGWDPIPVQASRQNGRGIVQAVGNGWEWTSTVFHPFPGFEPFPFYPGYSAPFFDGRHYVVKGASPRTAARLVRPSFRNWFRGEYPYTYSTFRLVES